MKLVIQSSSEHLTYNFGMWLTRMIKLDVLSNVDYRLLDSWDKVFEEQDIYETISGSPISTRTCFTSCFNFLVCQVVPGELTIRFSNTALIPGLNQVSADKFIRTITFGTTKKKGYPIVLNTFQKFCDDIQLYADMYIRGIL